MTGWNGKGSLRTRLRDHSSAQIVNMFAQYVFLARGQFIPRERITHPRDAKAACHGYIRERCSFRYRPPARGGRAATDLLIAPVGGSLGLEMGIGTTIGGRSPEGMLGMVRRALGLAAAVMVLAGCGPDAGSPPPDRPNLVLVIGDDLDYRDLRFMGSEVAQTPALDTLASQGFAFRQGYTTSSLCRPTLQSLLTGLRPGRYVERLQEIRSAIRRLDPDAAKDRDREVERFETLPRILGREGYASFQSGKYWEGSWAGAGFTDGMTVTDMEEGNRIARETMRPVFDFIDDHVDEPFFLWFAPMLPHLPHDPPQVFLDRYTGVSPMPLRRYYANVTRFDESVGALLAYLGRSALTERTLVVFLVDNGWQALPDRTFVDGPRGKGSIYDIGFRTPIVWRWPGRVPAGVISESLVSVLDVFPTLLDYAGAPIPDGLPGHSLRPLIEGEAQHVRDAVFGQMKNVEREGALAEKGARLDGAFVRQGRWRYVQYTDAVQELYDVEADPEETTDLAARHPEVVRELRSRLVKWSLSVNPPPRPKARR